jgi:hypothetical protein
VFSGGFPVDPWQGQMNDRDMSGAGGPEILVIILILLFLWWLF